MTPKEKAIRLFADLRYRSPGTEAGKAIAKDHALFCCDEIIQEIEPDELFQRYNERVTYWRDVKEEIKKL